VGRRAGLALETGIGLAGCLALALLGHGGCFHFLIAGLAYLVALVTGVLALFFPLSVERRRRFAWMFRLDTLHSCCLVAGLTAISYVPGVYLERWTDLRTMACAEALVPRIDEYRARHGVYPRSLDELRGPGVALPPCFLDGRAQYHGREDWFALDVPGELLSGWSFYSGKRSWEHYD
jgi:hypothetical protein